MRRNLALGIAAAAAALVMALSGLQPARANRANDTLTLADILPLGGVDMYYGSYPHTQFMSNMLFDTLVDYDPRTREIVPLLAKSWKLVGDNATEFQLRDDVTFHDGQKFTADDVVYTLGWLIDPKSRYQNKYRWQWIKGVEKTGPYSVRLQTDGRRPYDLLALTGAPIYPEHVRAAMAETSDFGRKPVGTGPYKLVEYSENAGRLVVARNPDYKWGGETKKPSNIGRVVVRSTPDQGAQVSGLMVGQVDIFRGLPADQAEALAQDPRFGLDVAPNIGLTYMWFDATGKAGSKALTDPKVRQALAMSVDRVQLEIIMNGNQHLPLPQNICWPDRVIGCAFTKTAPGYDPKRAKALLAEAGYPNGFEVRITSYVGRLTQLAEAVAGYYAAVGVKATIEPVTVTTYTKKAEAGQIQITVAGNSLGGVPDISQTFQFFFQAVDYTGDPEILKLGNAANVEMDPEKRRQIATQLFDRVAENNYISPLTALPQLFTHTNEVKVDTISSNSYGASISEFHWKDGK